MPNLELDYMEYANDAAAQAAYVTSASETVDQSQTTAGNNQTLGDSGDIEYKICQSFKLSGNLTVSAVELKQNSHTGTPSGDWTVRIETDLPGEPSGTLAHANASVAVSAPGDGNTVKCSFTPFALSGATTYWIVISVDAQSTDTNWYLGRTSGAYADGDLGEWDSASGTWYIYDGTRDLYFKIYIEASLQSYSEATIKTQGSYSLKGVARATDSLNKTLTRTI